MLGVRRRTEEIEQLPVGENFSNPSIQPPEPNSKSCLKGVLATMMASLFAGQGHLMQRGGRDHFRLGSSGSQYAAPSRPERSALQEIKLKHVGLRVTRNRGIDGKERTAGRESEVILSGTTNISDCTRVLRTVPGGAIGETSVRTSKQPKRLVMEEDTAYQCCRSQDEPLLRAFLDVK